MFFIKDFKKVSDSIVLIDTNCLINLVHKNCTKIDLDAIKKIFDNGIKPCITDLSFCELIVGCNNLNEFRNLYNDLSDMEFMNFVVNEPLLNLFKEYNYFSVDSEFQFLEFKSKSIKLMRKIIFPLFMRLFNFYLSTCIEVLRRNDGEYFEDAYRLFFVIYNDEVHSQEFNRLIYEHYENILNDNHQAKSLIKDLCCFVLNELLSKYNPIKFQKDVVENKIKKILKPTNFKKIFIDIKIDVNKSDEYNDIRLYNKFIRKQINNTYEFTFLDDGICFITSKLILCNVNFSINDLIDLYNIYCSTTQDINVHYFTNDCKRWKGFIEIEKELRPNINLFFNE